jgi:hypothetical protein
MLNVNLCALEYVASSGAGSCACHVFAVMLAAASSTGEVSISQAQLVRLSGRDRKSVVRGLRRLMRLGLVWQVDAPCARRCATYCLFSSVDPSSAPPGAGAICTR